MGELTAWQSLMNSVVLYLPRLLTGIVVLAVFWLIARSAQRVAQRLAEARHVDHDLTLLLGRIAGTCLFLFGVITALGTLGIDISALVAGLGLTGFALGFALRDIISNALSGMLVIWYKPFKHGDRIAVTALEGTVADVNLRYTVLVDGGKKIFVPNASLMTNPITVTTGDEPASMR
ncbi:MAG: mechanosensitive ion channel [Planctomycetia bacterium]|nr:mechanosensitive ion channel [Planctomycetia bacterium]